MSGTEITPSGSGSQDQPTRFYFFPRHFIYMEMLLFSLVSALMIFAWLPALLSLFTYGTVLRSALRAAIFLNFTAGSIILSIVFIKREMSRIRFILSNSYLTMRSPARDISICHASITEVGFMRTSLGGGVVTVKNDEKRIRIPLSLVNISDLTGRLAAICSRSAPDGAGDDATWERIRMFSAMSEMLSLRTAKAFKPMLTLCIAMLPVNVMTGAIFWDMPIIPLMFWGVAGPLFPAGAYGAGDLITRLRWLKRLCNGADRRDGAADQRVFARVGLLSAIVYFAAGICYRAIIIQ